MYSLPSLIQTTNKKKKKKRFFEANRRSWRQWLADNTKQGLSSLVTHGVGTLIAVELRRLVPDVDECDW
jgi:hypothetical protein